MGTLHMMNFKPITNTLNNEGFVFFTKHDIAMEEFEKIAGVQFSHIAKDFIRPQKENHNNPGAWSNIYSDGKFPPHTDFAYQSSPPKYIMLYCTDNKNSNRSTFVLDIHSIPLSARNKLSQILWKMSHPERSKALRLLKMSHEYGQSILRYDPTCMKPYFKKDVWAIDFINSIYNEFSKEITWKEGGVLVIDNWRCLHGRGDNKLTQHCEEKRIFERYCAYL
ncbi:hypothetical protein SB6421_05491 [Klebsiella huaxiensis]|nr:hypothetical protein SB6421_05491 [Klebsiella huaxiensis]